MADFVEQSDGYIVCWGDVWGVEPDLIREGGNIPVILTIEEYAKANVMLLPVGKSDDGAHSQNEKIDRENYIQGPKLFAAYMQEIANLPS